MKSVQAYADGINEYVKSLNGKLTLEFALIGSDFEPWKVEDTLAFVKLICFALTHDAY